MKPPKKKQSDATEVSVEVLAPQELATVDTGALIESINTLHAEANELAAQARVFADSATRKAILMGLKLIQLKDATPHGEWEGLFASGQKRVGKSNVNHGCHLDFSFETARRYIAVATRLMTQKLMPEQVAALMQIGQHGDPTEDEIALLDEITPAKSLRQLCIELGIIKPTPKELAAMQGDDAAKKPKDKEKRLTLAEQLARDRARAREQWFGTDKPGRIDPSSILSIIQMEVSHPADGTLRLLREEDLRILAEDFKAFSKYCLQLADES